MIRGFLLALVLPAAAEKLDGGLPGGFLELGSGARAMGMGRAFGAVADGPESLFWNPGGLGLPFKTAASLTRMTLYEGASLDELSVAHAFDRPFGLGFSVLSFSNGGLTRRDAANNDVGSFDDTRRAYILGWGLQPLSWLSFGAAHKLVTRKLADQSSSAMDADVGAAVRWRRLRAGLQTRNVMGAALGRDGGSDALARSYHLGAGYAPLEPLLATAELVSSSGKTDLRAGLEYALFQRVAFRAGWDGVAPTFGAGVLHRGFGLDYGVSQHSALGLSHRMTLRAGWGAPAEAKLAARARWRSDVAAWWTESRERSAARREQRRKAGEYISAGRRALDAGDYREANSYANLALHMDPASRAARELLERSAVASVSRELSAPAAAAAASSGTAPGAPELDELPAYRTRRRDALAVIIGVERYRDLIGADHAARDARAVAKYVERALGVPGENIVVRENERATLADVRSYLEGWLKEKAKPDSEVFIYFSGHGTPDPATGHGYIVPYDASPASIKEAGYSLRRLYETLGALPVKRALVVLDACFSGAGGPRTVLAKGTRPIVPIIEDPVLASGKIAVLSAASGSQISGTYQEKGHGLLTYYLLRGLQGEADADRDRKLSLVELYGYLLPKVVVEARRAYREQEPKLLPPVDVADPWRDEPLALLP